MVDPEGIVYGPGVGIPVVTIHDDECWHCRLIRKKAAIATVGFGAGLVEFDWPPPWGRPKPGSYDPILSR